MIVPSTPSDMCSTYFSPIFPKAKLFSDQRFGPQAKRLFSRARSPTLFVVLTGGPQVPKMQRMWDPAQQWACTSSRCSRDVEWGMYRSRQVGPVRISGCLVLPLTPTPQEPFHIKLSFQDPVVMSQPSLEAQYDHLSCGCTMIRSDVKAEQTLEIRSKVPFPT